jgi:hypothetical protein
MPAAYRAANRSGGTFVGDGLFGTKWAGLVVRMTDILALIQGARLNTLLAPSTPISGRHYEKGRRGFRDREPTRGCSAAQIRAGR